MNPVEVLPAEYEPGDIVKIIHPGSVYSSYILFFEEQNMQHLIRYWQIGKIPQHLDTLYYVEHVGKHRAHSSMLYIVRNLKNEVFIMGEDGLALVQRAKVLNVSEEEFLSILVD